MAAYLIGLAAMRFGVMENCVALHTSVAEAGAAFSADTGRS